MTQNNLDPGREQMRKRAALWGDPVDGRVEAGATLLSAERNPEIEKALDYVLEKNRDLYRRLA